MLQAILKIRLKQILRIARSIGLLRSLFLVCLFGIIVFVLFKQTAVLPNAYYSIAACVVLISMIQINRPDKRFLKIHFNHYKRILLVEYLLLLIPLFVCLFYHKQWILVLSLIAFAGLVVNLDFKHRQKSLNSFIQRLIPSDCFEWKSGIRRTLYFKLAFWIIGLATSFSIGSVPVVLFILGLFSLSFYEKGEPIQMILSYEMGTNKFLFRKIKRQWALYTILSVPLIIAFLVFHLDQWYIPVIEYLTIISLHIYIILTKYAFYQPNSKSGGAQAFGAIGAMALFIPIFIPLIWLLSVRFYFKSRENLNFYLNDYH